MEERVIFHVDVNSAFLSWSALKILKNDPSALDIRTVPSAVAGDIETRHGIITARSIPAKKYGIKTAEPVRSALQKYPNLILVKPDFETYKNYSRAFIKILKEYSPAVEQISIDEAFMDMTGTKAMYSSLSGEFPLNVAQKLKDDIYTRLGFTVNIGVSTNKLLAKMASDFEKPNKIHTLYQDEIPAKMWPLPINELYGCGKKTTERLNKEGIVTIGDAAKRDKKFFINILGNKFGTYIFESVRGISLDPVDTTERKPKSYSNEITLPRDISVENFNVDMPEIIKDLTDSVVKRLLKDNVRAFTVNITIKTNDFKSYTRQCTLPTATNKKADIEKNAFKLAKDLMLSNTGLFNEGKTIRLVGVGVSNLEDKDNRQLSLFDLLDEKTLSEEDKKIQEITSHINHLFGDEVIKIASELKEE